VLRILAVLEDALGLGADFGELGRAGAGFAACWLFWLLLPDSPLFRWAFAAKTGSANRIKAETIVIKAILTFCRFFCANMIHLLSLVRHCHQRQ